MWLRELRVQNLKRLRDFTLDLREPDGKPRMWTVLIGPNGTGKTSILQAVALAAAGMVDANELCPRETRESLLDKRLERPKRKPGRQPKLAPQDEGPCVEIDADFVFGPRGRHARASHPLWGNPRDELIMWSDADGEGDWLRSRVRVRPADLVRGRAAYVSREAGELREGSERRESDPSTYIREMPMYGDPLVDARDDQTRAYWFVAAYGVQRDLPRTALAVSRPERPSLARLQPLFGPRELVGPNFASILESPKVKRAYAELLRDVLLSSEHLVPGITNMELRGKGGVTKTEHLTESHRFEQTVKGEALMLPAKWLSHGYQSSLAWLSDLVGQIVLEANGRVEPKEMEGLVLIDEIDLYLHPSWQVGLIQALRDTLPNMQFIVTTHSPILLSAFRREEVVMLDFDSKGNVAQVETPRDPRLLTGSELYESFFGIDRLYPAELGDKLDLYTRLARNPRRTLEDEATRAELEQELRAEGITRLTPPTPRLERPATG